MLNELKCVCENVEIDKYLELYKYVRENMEHPEWSGTFAKEEINGILKDGGKIWLYFNKQELVRSMFNMPIKESSLRKHNVMFNEIEVGALGPIMVSPKYVGNGLQNEMIQVLNKYCIDNNKKYIYTKVCSDNVYCLRNLIKNGYILKDEYENERGMNSALIKEL